MRIEGYSARRSLVLLALTLALLAGACSGSADDRTANGRRAASEETVRIGWQVPWATQGQVVQVMKRTNVLALHQLKGDFKGFTFGAPLNEAAIAGGVDVLFTADQPAATLLANSDRFVIVGRLMYNRVSIYVPPDSSIKSVADLRGKRVAMPFGAAAQRDALKAVKQAGLDPAKDITAVNLDVLEQSGVVRAGSRSSWGDIDALVGFDPTPAIFEAEGNARMIHVGTVVAVVVMSKDLLTRSSDTAERFLEAYIEAWYYYAQHQPQANEWFKQESRLRFDGQEPLAVAASVEPNVRAKTLADLRVLLNDADLRTLQEAADFIYDRKLVKTRVPMRQHVDQRLMTKATQELREPTAIAPTAG